MDSIELHRTADDTLREDVAALASAVEASDGVQFLSDHLWLDLRHVDAGTGSAGFLAGLARSPSGLAAYAQASRTNSGLVVESTTHPDHRDDAGLERRVLDAVLGQVARDGGAHVTWWVHGLTDHHDKRADELGLTATRDLYQMRRTLPIGIPVEVPTRPFDPDRDEASWIRVNNRAFAGHGEQGGWDLATLRQRESEPWFDPEGFRIHERDGEMAAFCWTKLHTDVNPPLGEIYVVGVDPDFQRLGLGRQLTLAGLESINQRGIDIGMLYVDAGNTPAVEMYLQLGFSIHRTDRAYEATIAPTSEPSQEAQ